MEKRRDIHNFYVDHEFIRDQLWKKFKDICRREETTASEKLRAFIRNYVMAHTDGNPQQTLDYIMKHGHPYRAEANKCYCGEKAVAEIVATNGYKGFVCKTHLEKNKTARLLKTVKKVG